MKMKYKAGDKVRVRLWEEMEREFGSTSMGDIVVRSDEFRFTKEMREFCGKEFTVKVVDEVFDNYLFAEIASEWHFCDEMLCDASGGSSVRERAKILDEAAKIICSDRNDEYGEPEDNFEVIGKLWSAFLTARCAPVGTEIEMGPAEVAEMMALFKIGRLASAYCPKRDSFVDCAGYIACAGEIALRGEGEENDE